MGIASEHRGHAWAPLVRDRADTKPRPLGHGRWPPLSTRRSRCAIQSGGRLVLQLNHQETCPGRLPRPRRPGLSSMQSRPAGSLRPPRLPLLWVAEACRRSPARGLAKAGGRSYGFSTAKENGTRGIGDGADSSPWASPSMCTALNEHQVRSMIIPGFRSLGSWTRPRRRGHDGVVLAEA